MNIIFYDNIERSTMLKIFHEFYDMDVYYTYINNSSDSFIKKTLEIGNVGSFAILTKMPSKYKTNFPNNIIDLNGDANIHKLCNQITYIMTHFGREYKHMSNVFICSDTHFNHTNIIKYCNRPYSSVDEMNADMIARWNSVVGSYDVLCNSKFLLIFGTF